jgi:molybdopterin/thiamine biosynthesis adenylyltransferase/rhodanese-related sulfurtransferase
MDNITNKERYSRHLSLQGFGEAGQRKLQEAKVLVIGAGGLGCPVLQYLAAAGIGVIGIADDDRVSLSNLQRQVLYGNDDLGRLKAACAGERLRHQNPEIEINVHIVKVSTANALELIAAYDIIVDGTDNFASRYLINDACVLLGKPLVFAAVFRYEGQLAVFNVPDATGLNTNYRDLFPNPPSAAEAPDCNVAGVMGVLPGIMGVMQATEVIKLIAGIGKPLVNQLYSYNSLTAESYTIHISPDALARQGLPKDESKFRAFQYDSFCNASLPGDKTINAAQFEDFKSDENAMFLDVREYGEWPEAEFKHLHIPLPRLAGQVSRLNKDKIIVFCQTGRRSLQAQTILTEHFGSSKEVYSLAGGIIALESGLED